MKTTSQASKASKKRILIVDDDPEVLEIFSALLGELGYEIQTAENALAAIASVVHATPDLILADIRMPIVGGMDLVRELKAHRDSRGIPVVAFTGYDSPEMRATALEAGYDDYLAKPLDPAPFIARIEALVNKSKPAKSATDAASKPAAKPVAAKKPRSASSS
jgi:DNA-binding response OmpR family regulator